MTTLAEFIEKHDLDFECRMVPSRPDGLMDESARHFRCTILYLNIYSIPSGQVSHSYHKMSLYFSQGSAHTDDPTLADVLDCLASDASGYENARTFEEWTSEYGYDADSRSAERIFKTVKRQAEQLKRLIGQDAYNELLWETERL